MTFPEIWHLLTTSRYTRKLEQENFELRQEVKELTRALRRGGIAEDVTPDSQPVSVAARARLRGGRFTGFSQIKKKLESQEPQPKGA
jgi:hypothetical protein